MHTRRAGSFQGSEGMHKAYAGKYYCYNLLYWERYQYIQHAIDREKEVKKWRREKKEALINSMNPAWRFLNAEI